MSARFAILLSIPGISEITAFTVLIEMPELGTLDAKQVASLAGLAPVSRQSGKWQGKEHIRGGRRELRCALYMPALAAMRFNADLKAVTEILRAKGKPTKVVITAIMRKLIVLANALVAAGAARPAGQAPDRAFRLSQRARPSSSIAGSSRRKRTMNWPCCRRDQ